MSILFFQSNLIAQKNKQRIAVFTPIYLDSAFTYNTFKLWGNYLPKQMLPGLEFYNGIISAIDSLKISGVENLIIDIYDYKSKNNSIEELIADSSNNLHQTNLIIASFNNRIEVPLLADFALLKKIPIISATYPNDGSITNNPYFFLINPTFKAHTKSICDYLHTKSNLKNIIYVTNNTSFESMFQSYFIAHDTINIKPLHLVPINISDSISLASLSLKLDSTVENIVLSGSVDEELNYKLIETIAKLKDYKTTIIGMPTWDAMSNLSKQLYKGPEIIYTTTNLYSKSNKLINHLNEKYKLKYNSSANDLFYKGYETMLRFGKIISLYGAEGMQLFSSDLFKVFHNLELNPVYNSINSTQIDYYENEKIYFVKKVDGIIK